MPEASSPIGAAGRPASELSGAVPAVVPPAAEPRPVHELAEKMLEEAAAEIDRADQKASLLIGSLGIAFSIVLSALIGGDWSPQSLHPVGAALWIIGALAAGASVVSAALAVWPRLSRSTPGSITYWGQVKDLGSPQAVADALTERGLLPPERTYQQLLVLSAVVQRKYRAIRWAMVLAGAGIALVTVAYFIVN
ncbi:hypothetical protein JOD63_003223 [Microbacterium terrae]|uniref:Pycsar effector protein domain-containing protein n=1 Tax=Microbacterium terrae TaxID=69369 RepID=A0A0M2H6B4_9MICO|nr:Pycsar system effector family protein [Microbacterium terrae]KJL40112.1 hypothetical protein RS81_01702 [Microbacterium terrae]MBP1079255.1 hypothetical protein [Microbacterium terrae]GLJ98655.1 hypothetical protein GCM10017594_18520 [Microbacterium terrae]